MGAPEQQSDILLKLLAKMTEPTANLLDFGEFATRTNQIEFASQPMNLPLVTGLDVLHLDGEAVDVLHRLFDNVCDASDESQNTPDILPAS
jgi:hypothetical protein